MGDVGLYPQGQQRLQHEIDQLLESSPNRDLDPDLLIVPHGSLNQIGELLAAAYGAIDPGTFRNVVFLAGKHRDIGPTVAFTEQTRRTPLGTLRVDEMFTKQLLLDESFSRHDKLHDLEQAINPQLPFLQTVKDRFNIVPIIIGNGLEGAKVDAVASSLKGSLQESDLLITVTNLATSPEEERVKRADSSVINAIRDRNLGLLEETGREHGICGWRALEIGLATLDETPVFHQLGHRIFHKDNGVQGAGSFCFSS
ncbi:MAG: AmmeMemoRadiSam system protein B [Candidatus Nanohaloarchaea archaeon]|nr:AmmeMemoRadiSam system protein B [Candidatus Nanohaloarchaea archaeon]